MAFDENPTKSKIAAAEGKRPPGLWKLSTIAGWPLSADQLTSSCLLVTSKSTERGTFWHYVECTDTF